MVREVWCFWKVSRSEWLELKIRELTRNTLGFHVSPFYCFLKQSENSGLAAAGVGLRPKPRLCWGTCCFQNCLGERIPYTKGFCSISVHSWESLNEKGRKPQVKEEDRKKKKRGGQTRSSKREYCWQKAVPGQKDTCECETAEENWKPRPEWLKRKPGGSI